MGRRRKERRPRFACDEPPCIYVVFDDRRKIYKVFVEETGDYIIAIPTRKISGACALLEELTREGYREATLDHEIDYLARRYLKVKPAAVEENEEEE